MLFKLQCYICLIFLSFASTSFAQNTGGVFSPVVNEDTRGIKYLAAVNPDNAVLDFAFAQRLHYEQSINDNLMWRVLGQTRRTEDNEVDLDFIGAELFWELSDDDDTHKHGLRFDSRIRGDGRAEQLGVNWAHQWNFTDGWNAKAIVLTLREFGDNRADGINIQTRTSLTKKLDNGVALGFENYSFYGNTGDFGSLSEQTHTIGPLASAPLGKRLNLVAGPLFGLTEASPDFEARIWITGKL